MFLLTALSHATGPVEARGQGDTATVSANRQYAAAVRLQNLESYGLAIAAWESFLRDYPTDARAAKASYYLGVCAYQEGDLKKALTAFQDAARDAAALDQPDAAYLYLGMTQYVLATRGDASRFADAGRTFGELVQKYPSSQHLPEARYYQIEARYMQGEKDWAAEAYAKWLLDYPQSPLRANVLYAAGVALEETGKATEAGAAYDAFLKENPKHELAAEVAVRRGETIFQAGDYEKALAWFDRALEASTEGATAALADHATLRKAETLARLQQFTPAAELYASIPTRFPQSTHANPSKLAAGKCYFLAGDLPSARKWLTEAYNVKGETQKESLHLIARCMLKDGKPEDAIRFITATALPLVRGDAEKTAELLLAQAESLYSIPSRRNEAERLYATIATDHAGHPVAPEALYMAAFSALERGDYSAAAGYADQFLTRFSDDPHLADVLHVAAESAMQRNDPAAAESYYRRAIEAKPESENAALWRVRRALAFSLQKRPDDVIQTLQSVVGQLGDKDLTAEAQFLLGDALLRKQDTKNAVSWLEQSLKTQPKWRRADETRFVLAEAYLAQGDTPRVQATLNVLLREHPDSPLADRAHYRLAESYHRSGEPRRAAEYYQTVATKYPRSAFAPDALYELACIQMEQNEMKAADATLTSLVARFPDHLLAARASFIRGRARYQLKDFQGAADDIQGALAKLTSEKDQADALYLLGLCQLGLERHEEAAATLARLLQDSPDYPGAEDARYQMGWALKLAGKEDPSHEAFEALARSRSQTPAAAEARYHIGERDYAAKRYKEASEWFERAARDATDPTMGRGALHKLGWARYQQDDLAGAADAFERQLETYPGGGAIEADARFMLAECLFRDGKTDEALDAYGKLKLDDLSNEAYKAIALLHAGQAAALQNDWRASVGWLSRLRTEHPQSNEAILGLYELAWARQKLGETDEAIRLYEEVISKTTAESAARAQFMIGEILFERKQHAEAISRFLLVIDGYDYPLWQANAMYEAARCFEVLKQPAQAVKLYSELIEKFPRSDKAPLARTRLRELNGS